MATGFNGDDINVSPSSTGLGSVIRKYLIVPIIFSIKFVLNFYSSKCLVNILAITLL